MTSVINVDISNSQIGKDISDSEERSYNAEAYSKADKDSSYVIPAHLASPDKKDKKEDYAKEPKEIAIGKANGKRDDESKCRVCQRARHLASPQCSSRRDDMIAYIENRDVIDFGLHDDIASRFNDMAKVNKSIEIGNALSVAHKDFLILMNREEIGILISHDAKDMCGHAL